MIRGAARHYYSCTERDTDRELCVIIATSVEAYNSRQLHETVVYVTPDKLCVVGLARTV
jgi:hypothetical protein